MWLSVLCFRPLNYRVLSTGWDSNPRLFFSREVTDRLRTGHPLQFIFSHNLGIARLTKVAFGVVSPKEVAEAFASDDLQVVRVYAPG